MPPANEGKGNAEDRVRQSLEDMGDGGGDGEGVQTEEEIYGLDLITKAVKSCRYKRDE